MKCQFKIEVEHKPGCYSVKNAKAGVWKVPWVRFPEVVYRNGSGKEEGDYLLDNTMFLSFQCANPTCPARAIVRAEQIDALLARLEAGK